jgi:hypothetical protein
MRERRHAFRWGAGEGRSRTGRAAGGARRPRGRGWLAAVLAAGALVGGCARASGSEGVGVVFRDDFDRENGGVPRADYRALARWQVVAGSVDLEGRYPFEFLPPGNGMYLDLDGSTMQAGTIRTRTPLVLEPGEYVLSYQAAGCQHVAVNDVLHVTLGTLVRQRLELAPYEKLRTYRVRFTVPARTAAHLQLAQEGGDNVGMLFDNVEIRRL